MGSRKNERALRVAPTRTMIDFRFAPRLESPRDFLSQFRPAEGPLPAHAFRLLRDFLLSHQGVQEEVLLELCRWSDRELEEFLDQCWRSEVHETIALAEGVLARRGLRGLLAWSERLLADEAGARWLVDVLAEVRDDHATRILLLLLDHPLQSVRRRAADGLASHRSHVEIRPLLRFLAEPLTRHLDHPDPLKAVRALHRIADPSLEPGFGRDAAHRAERVLINCVRHERRSAVRGDAIAALGEIGSRAAVRCLVDLLGREEQTFHRDVVIALRKIHPDRAMIALLGLLQSPDPLIREEAASALGAIGDRQAVRRLKDLLDDDNVDVRQEAVLALGKLGGRDVLVSLERALADSDPQVRTAACGALADSLGRRAQGKLIRALYDGSADVRSEAAYHLGNIGDEDARHHLEVCLADHARDAFGDRVSSIARRSLFRLDLPTRQASEG